MKVLLINGSPHKKGCTYKIEKNTVQETLIIPLYARKVCSELYPDLYRDETAVRLVGEIDYDFSQAEKNDRKVKEIVVLEHVGDTLCTLRQRQCPDVHTAQVDFSVLYIPQGGDQSGNGGFSAAGGAYQGIDCPRAMCRSIPCSTSLW